MNTGASASHNAGDFAKDAREGRDATASTSGDIQSDLQSLREEFGRLAEQVGTIVADTGNAAWKRARSSMDGVVSDASARGRDAVGAVRDVSDNVVDAIDASLKKRPYTTLALVAGLGFLFGTTWRR